MAQQTAVEWFYQRILAKDINQVFEQANQMHKEQIVDAYEQGSSDEIIAYDGTRDFKHGLNYYNETYNKYKKQ